MTFHVFFKRFYVIFYLDFMFFERFYVGEVSINHSETAQSAASGVLNPQCKKQAQIQPAVPMCQFLCAGTTM